MKKILLYCFCLSMPLVSFTQKVEAYQLSSHILDIGKGLPAPNVNVILEQYNSKTEQWHRVVQKTTDDNGRIKDFLPYQKSAPNNGIYKLRFLVAPYFKKYEVSTFYPFVEVVFQISDERHYHVPITISPYGYSTYRGN